MYYFKHVPKCIVRLLMILQVYAIARTLATFLHEYTYIRALTFEIPELLVYVAIGFLFRLRNFEPFETIELGKNLDIQARTNQTNTVKLL